MASGARCIMRSIPAKNGPTSAKRIPRAWTADTYPQYASRDHHVGKTTNPARHSRPARRHIHASCFVDFPQSFFTGDHRHDLRMGGCSAMNFVPVATKSSFDPSGTIVAFVGTCRGPRETAARCLGRPHTKELPAPADVVPHTAGRFADLAKRALSRPAPPASSTRPGSDSSPASLDGRRDRAPPREPGLRQPRGPRPPVGPAGRPA